MAHTKAQGSTRNGRDSAGQRLGTKAGDSQLVSGGSIIVRQRGTKITAGTNAGMGKDHTIFAKVAGRVKFTTSAGGKKVSIIPVK